TSNCTDGTPPTGLRSFEPCTRNEDCRSRYCNVGLQRCITECSLARPACPDDDRCVDAGPISNDQGVCAPSCPTDVCGDGLTCRNVTDASGAQVKVCGVG